MREQWEAAGFKVYNIGSGVEQSVEQITAQTLALLNKPQSLKRYATAVLALSGSASVRRRHHSADPFASPRCPSATASASAVLRQPAAAPRSWLATWPSMPTSRGLAGVSCIRIPGELSVQPRSVQPQRRFLSPFAGNGRQVERGAHRRLLGDERAVVSPISGLIFGGAAGCFYAIYKSSTFPGDFSLNISITVLCMVILGGMGSLGGSVVAAFIIGIAQSLFSLWMNPQRVAIAIFGIMIVVLIVRPRGLFGREGVLE